MSGSAPFRAEALAAHRERRTAVPGTTRRRAQPRVLAAVPLVVAALAGAAFLPVHTTVAADVTVREHRATLPAALRDDVPSGRSTATWEQGSDRWTTSLQRTGRTVHVLDARADGRGVFRVSTSDMPLFRYLVGDQGGVS